MLSAFIDESMQVVGDGYYVIAAAVIVDNAADGLREGVVRITPRGQRFHWRTEQPRERRAMTVSTDPGLSP